MQPTTDSATTGLLGCIDVPADGATLERGQVDVRGWHLWDGAPVVAVAITADGEVVGRGGGGSQLRPDVAEALGDPAYARAGWVVSADLSRVVAEHVELGVIVWRDMDPAVLAPLNVQLNGTAAPDWERAGGSVEPAGTIDLPNHDPIARGVVTLRGWALSPDGPVTRMEILVNGQAVGAARLGVGRPDVAQQYPLLTHALLAGYEDLLDLSELPATDTEVRIAVTARTAGGAAHVVAERVYQLLDAEPLPSRAVRDQELDLQQSEFYASVPARAGAALSLVVFTHDLGYGGGQLWLSELLRLWDAGRAFDCTVIAPRDGALREELERAGIRVHVTQGYPIDDIEAYRGRVGELALLVRAIGANAMLVNTMGSFIGADVARSAGLPTVWAIHESFTPTVFWAAAYPPDYVDRHVCASAMRSLAETAAVVFEAEQTRLQYVPASRPEHCLVVPYGIDTEAITSYRDQVSQARAREMIGVEVSARLIVVMGTTEPRKAQNVIAEAFAQLADERADLLLAFVGVTDTAYGDCLRRYIDEAGMAERTHLVPVVKDTYPWYRAADLLLCASDVESLPRSVLEAMCFGVPVLATAVFGLPELITDGETGYLFQPRDLEAAVAALRRIEEAGPEELARVGEAGRQHVLANYDSSGYATDIRALLDGLRLDASATPGSLLRPR